MTAQSTILMEDKHQGWGITTILEDTRCAFHRFDSKTNPFEVWALTLLASGCCVAEEATDMTQKKDRGTDKNIALNKKNMAQKSVAQKKKNMAQEKKTWHRN